MIIFQKKKIFSLSLPSPCHVTRKFPFFSRDFCIIDSSSIHSVCCLVSLVDCLVGVFSFYFHNHNSINQSFSLFFSSSYHLLIYYSLMLINNIHVIYLFIHLCLLVLAIYRHYRSTFFFLLLHYCCRCCCLRNDYHRFDDDDDEKWWLTLVTSHCNKLIRHSIFPC